MEKNVFIVRGSEDGIIGAYTNIKAAYAHAIHYITGDHTHHGKKDIPTYRKACNKLSEIGCVYVGDCTRFAHAEIIEITLGNRFKN